MRWCFHFLNSTSRNVQEASPPASFRQYLHIGRREDSRTPAEMCLCCSLTGVTSMQRARPGMPFRQPGAVSTDEMKFKKMRSSVAEHRPHKAARTGSSPVASTSFRCVAQSGQSTAFGTQGPEVRIFVHRPLLQSRGVRPSSRVS